MINGKWNMENWQMINKMKWEMKNGKWEIDVFLARLEQIPKKSLRNQKQQIHNKIKSIN